MVILHKIRGCHLKHTSGLKTNVYGNIRLCRLFNSWIRHLGQYMNACAVENRPLLLLRLILLCCFLHLNLLLRFNSFTNSHRKYVCE